ncbi:MAG: bifunctional metallophosphatase/5'-nucleotidase [Croceibacterium sp.]
MLLRFLPIPAALALAACATVPSVPAAPVEVGIIAINDFHGALEPPKSSVSVTGADGKNFGVPAGGAAYLATAVEQVRAKYPNHLTVAAGDLTGGSQLASAIHLDEPAVGVMNRIGLEYTAVGNHEFDRGTVELTRLQTGGCARNALREPCGLETFAGAQYHYLAANVVGPDGKTLFPGTALKTFGTGRGAVTVGIIGLTLKGTDALVSASGIAGYRFLDEVQTINADVAQLKAQGADAIVVLFHQGVRTIDPPNPDGCNSPTGELYPLVPQLDPRVDVIVSGHTHWQYVCEWPSSDPAKTILVTSAGLYGKMVTDIRLTIDPASGQVLTRAAHNVIVQSEPYRGAINEVPLRAEYPRFAADPAVAAYVAPYIQDSLAFANRPIGKVSGPADLGVNGNASMGGTLGNLIADAQLDATRAQGAQIALMNVGGIRAALNPGPDGAVTFGMLYKVQPFENTLVTMTLTGAELKTVLEQGIDDVSINMWLAPSAGFLYRYDMARAPGDRVTAITLNGTPIDPLASYRVTTNSFLADGGDTFTVLAKARDKVVGQTDVSALEEWIRAVPVREIPQELRYMGG